MKKTPESAVFTRLLNDTYTTDEDRAKFEREVALLVASAEIVRAAEAMRAEKDIKKAAIARNLGVSREVVSALLNGPRGVPDLRTIAGVYDQLDLYLEVKVKRQPQRGRRHKPIEVAVAA